MTTNSINPQYTNHINCHIVLDILIYFHSPSPFMLILISHKTIKKIQFTRCPLIIYYIEARFTAAIMTKQMSFLNWVACAPCFYPSISIVFFVWLLWMLSSACWHIIIKRECCMPVICPKMSSWNSVLGSMFGRQYQIQ